jgi:hypothetical protein
MVDWLAGLMLRHPGIATVPLVAFLLLLCFALYAAGFRRVPYFWPGQLGAVLRVCFKSGLGLLMILCLLGCAHFAMQTGLARHSTFMSPFLLAVLVVCWLLVVVPCVFRDENRKREKRKQVNIGMADRP